MNLRSNYVFFCASLLLSGAAYAQTASAAIPASMAAKKDARSLARIEVSFSGSQTQRFVFEESADAKVERRMGVGMRTVGTGAIKMGERKTVINIQREDAKPEIFHGNFEIVGGGKLEAVLALQVGDEKTLNLVGGKPTQVTVKRFR